MADNLTTQTTLSTVPDATVIATDNIGGVNYQRVKVVWGVDGTATDASTTDPLPIGDAGGSLTVDNGGTFAVQAAQSGAWNITNISGTVSLPTGAATAAKQPALGTAGTASADVITVQGIASMTALKVDGSAVAQPVTDNSGSLTVDAPVGTPVFVRLSDGSSAIATLPVSLAAGATAIAKAEDVASADADVGVPAMAVRKATPANTSGTDGDYEMLQMSAGRLWTSSTIDAALPAGTNAIGKLASNTGVTIGAVEIAAAQTLATVTTVSTVTGGGIAHDGADSGNPIKVGARAALTLSDDTMVANADRTDLVSDADGALIVRNQFPLGDLISERVTDTGGSSTAFTNFGATASTRSYVTAIAVYNSSATAGTVDFRDGAAGSVLWTMPLPAGGGSVMASDVPFFRTSTNTALAYDVSGALTTVTISIAGFKSKV